MQQYVVGYASATNWVARYSFSVGSTGANALQWDLINNYLAGGSLTAGLEWQINTSPSSYAKPIGRPRPIRQRDRFHHRHGRGELPLFRLRGQFHPAAEHHLLSLDFPGNHDLWIF